MPHAGPGKTIREAASFRVLRWAVMIALGLQIIVGQALVVSGHRPMNPQAESVLNTFGLTGAELLSWSVGILAIVSALFMPVQFWAAIVYVVWTVSIVAGIWRIDPFIAGLYVVYSGLGVIMIVLTKKPGRGE